MPGAHEASKSGHAELHLRALQRQQGTSHPVPHASLLSQSRTSDAGHGLTPREGEVLLLLARGRNSPYIQEELHISYNTARTHVRHIYEKRGFHTQQELIDAVEALRAASG